MAPSLPATYSHLTLASRPKAAIDPNLATGTFKLSTDVPLRPESVGKGEVLVRVEWLSLDPAMRGASPFLTRGRLGCACSTSRILESGRDWDER